MAQVTQSLIDSWKMAIASDLPPSFTLNEFSQLCFVWERMERMNKRRLMFNPFTGKPRRPEDIRSDPAGALIHDPEEPLLMASR